MVMQSLSDSLRAWRSDRTLSLGRLAKLAGVGKATLSRWEAGTHTPRPVELCAVLDVLGITGAKQAQLLRGYAPLAVAPLLKSAHVAPLPSVGELLYALRLRAGMSQADTARSAGITQTLLSRWERGASLPTDAERHTVCFALGATADEAAMLITQTFPEDPLPDNRRELLNRFQVVRCTGAFGDKELPVIAIATKLARIVRRGDAEMHDFLPIWAEQAQIAHSKRIPLVSSRITARSRAVLTTLRGNIPSEQVPVVLTHFEQMRDFAVRLAAMQEWIPRFTEPVSRAYFLNGVVKAAVVVDKAYALRLMEEITTIIAGDPVEFPIRMENRAAHLLVMNEPVAALAVLEKHAPLSDPHGFFAGVWELTRARAFAAVGEKQGAFTALTRARAALLPSGAAQYGETIAGVERFVS